MKVEYTNRATRDLLNIASISRQQFGDSAAAEIEQLVRKLVEQIRANPRSRPNVVGRPQVHVAALVRYPFKMFYRVLEDRIRILHVRHTSQRPWEGN